MNALNEKVVKQHVEAAMDELDPKEFKTTHGGTVIHHIPSATSYKIHTLGGPAGTIDFKVEHHPSGKHIGVAGYAQQAGQMIRDHVKSLKNESTASLIESITEGDTITSARLFNEALRSRIDEKVAAKKKEVAARIDNAKTFEAAAKHKSHHIRMQVAKHPNTPHDVLNKLVNDKDIRVAHAALANPKTGQVEVKVDDKKKKSPLNGLIKHISKYKEEDK